MSDYAEPPPADAPYPAVRLLRRHGNWIAIAFGVVPVLAGLWAMLALGSLVWLGVGIVVGAAAGFLMRSFVELVRIIADMLLPR
jgi:hypothetical protein